MEKGEEAQLAVDDAKARQEAEAELAPIAVQAPADPAEAATAPDDMFKATAGRWGSRDVSIDEVTLLGEDGQPSHLFHSGEQVTVRMRVSAREPVADFVFGLGIFNAEGVCCYGTNTSIEEMASVALAGEGVVEFAVDRLDLTEGTYKVDVAVHKLDGFPYDYHRLLYTFRVKSRVKDVGVFRPPHRWTFSDGVKLRPTNVA